VFEKSSFSQAFERSSKRFRFRSCHDLKHVERSLGPVSHERQNCVTLSYVAPATQS
jgi:hypothetical protein